MVNVRASRRAASEVPYAHIKFAMLGVQFDVALAPAAGMDPSLQSIIHDPLFHCSLFCIILHKSLELMILCCKACLTLWEYPSSLHTSKLLYGNRGNFIPNTFLKFFQSVRIVNTLYLSACTTNRSHKNLNRGGHNSWLMARSPNISSTASIELLAVCAAATSYMPLRFFLICQLTEDEPKNQFRVTFGMCFVQKIWAQLSFAQ
jgi:hypothetical protein